MTNSDDKLKPSLLEDASRGGDTNEGGISFQAAVVMAHLPRWLASEGFTSMIREGMFDAEAQFFVPGHSLIKEAIEVKDHVVTPSEFWEEIKRFKEVDVGSPNSYQWFTLASAGLSETLHPLRNGLRRVRDPYSFYQHDAALLDNSYQEYIQRVKRLGGTEDDAEFLFRRVLLQDDWSLNRAHGKAIVKQALSDHLPHHQEMPARVIEDIYIHLGTFVQGRRAQPISRTELEKKLSERVPENLQSSLQAIKLFTGIDNLPSDTNQICFAWESFFGGSTRNYPPPEIWNKQLLGELNETRGWMIKHRRIRRVYLEGNRRLSASVAIGFVFSAVAGFAIDMVNRSEVWSTDAHATADTLPYQLVKTRPSETLVGKRLIVTLGILRDIIDDVEANLSYLGLEGMPSLHFHGEQPIQSPQQLNLIVREVKSLIAQTLRSTGAHQIDLFLAGPAPLALFLGHRLNATTVIQCYEQTGIGGYVQTCCLS